MDVKFAVHNPHAIPVTKTVTLDGQEVTATVHGFEVELQSLDGLSGTYKLRCAGKDMEEARQLFRDGAAITATFSETQ